MKKVYHKSDNDYHSITKSERYEPLSVEPGTPASVSNLDEVQPLFSTSAEFSSGDSHNSHFSPQNAEILPEVDNGSAIRKRFALLRTAQRLIDNKSMRECMTAPVPEATHVVGRFDPERKNASYKNLQRCGFVACPFCAYKQAFEDRLRMSVAMAQIKKQGNFAVMVTLTLAHKQSNTLDELTKAITKAYDRVFSGRWFTSFAERWGLLGRIKAVEVTFGRSGWHPHLHVIFELELEIIEPWTEVMQIEIAERYVKKLDKLGFHASSTYGVDVRTADSDIADYIAKHGREPLSASWGAESEMTLAPVKKANSKGLTPFQLLAAATGDDDSIHALMLVLSLNDPKTAQKRAESLYSEYFHAMYRRSRLRWSKGMEERLNLTEAIREFYDQNDDPITRGIDVVLIECHDREGWSKVVRDQLRAELLAIIRTGDPRLVDAFLAKHQIKGHVTDIAYELLLFVQVEF